MKNLIKLILEFSKGLKNQKIETTRIFPSRNQFQSYFEKSVDKKIKNLKIDKNFLTIGSCFSVRIANYAFKKNNEFIYEKNSFNFLANWGRVYTVANLNEIVEYTLDNNKKIHIEKQKDFFFDPLREDSISLSDSENKCYQNIINHRKFSKEAFKNASTILLILGLNEVWYDKEKKIYWGTKPSNDIFLKHENRFEVINLNYKYNFETLEKLINNLKNFNNKLNIVLSLGPVPQEAVYSSSNILEAFFYNKSVLRAVINELVEKNKNFLSYFPLFEYLYFNNPLILKSDNRHINDIYIEKALKLLDN